MTKQAHGARCSKISRNPKKYENCKVICLCLPDFDTTCTSKQHKRWGYNFAEIIDRLEATINHYVPDQSKQVDLVIHDFGSWVGLCYATKHSTRVRKVAIFDVGLGLGRGLKPFFMTAFIIILYQWWWAFAYIVSQVISTWLGQIIFYMYALLVPSMFKVLPTNEFHRPREYVRVHMCYLYYQFWRGMLLDRSQFPRPEFPKCPVLFMVRRINIIN